jgi:hypothetical protein
MTTDLVAEALSTTIIVAGIDSKTALAWARKSYSRREDAIPLIEQLYTALRANDRARRLILTWLVSEDNAADTPSRSERSSRDALIAELNPTVMERSWTKLRDARDKTLLLTDRAEGLVAEMDMSDETDETEKRTDVAHQNEGKGTGRRRQRK